MVYRMFVPNCAELVLLLDEVCVMNKSASPFSFWHQMFCVRFVLLLVFIDVDLGPPFEPLLTFNATSFKFYNAF